MEQIKKYLEWCERNHQQANNSETLFMYVEIMKSIGINVLKEEIDA